MLVRGVFTCFLIEKVVKQMGRRVAEEARLVGGSIVCLLSLHCALELDTLFSF